MTSEFEEKIHEWINNLKDSKARVHQAQLFILKGVLAVFAEHQQEQNKKLKSIKEELDFVNETSHPLGTRSWLHEWNTLKKMFEKLTTEASYV